MEEARIANWWTQVAQNLEPEFGSVYQEQFCQFKEMRW